MNKVTKPRRMKSAAALTAGVALALGAAAIPASAATDDGLWYYEQMGIGTAHADGITGEGVTIAVIDGPINTDVPTLKNANIEVREDSFCYSDATATTLLPARSTDISDSPVNASHGTNVASFITGTGDGYAGEDGVVGVAPGAQLLYYAAWTGNTDDDSTDLQCFVEDGADRVEESVGAAMNEAMDAGADIISISAGLTPGPDDLYTAYIRAIREGVVVLGAQPNSSALEFNASWPAAANGAVAVQAADSTGTIQTTDGVPNDDRGTTVIAPGVGLLVQGKTGGLWEEQRIAQGTSYATPA
jgi:subtilisin family serine protease